MTKRLAILTAIMAMSLTGWAQGPNDTGTYYQNANGMYGEGLKSALYRIISKHKDIGYNANLKEGQIGLKEAYKQTDVRPDGYLRDWYSSITSYEPGSSFGSSVRQEGDGYNREHLMPQSWYNKVAPMVSDVMQVVPTDGYINSRRNDHPFCEVISDLDRVNKSSGNYSKWGSPSPDANVPSGVTTVFEPNDEVKGDIARIYFYMATCYENVITEWKGNNVATVIGGTPYSPLLPWQMDVMMRWSRQDPVDAIEVARNKAVYAVQNNRNPFVDYPGLEDYVWGEKTGQPFVYDNFGNDDGATVTAMPVFSPAPGTYYNSVEISLTSATEGATIYYTTSGAPPTEQSTLYEGPFTLTGSCTVKAIAVKDGVASYQAVGVYNVKQQDPPEEEKPVDGTIALNNDLFGTSYTGSDAKSGTPLKGTKNGVTVSYSLGSGSYLYCNAYQIRLYKGNLLTVAVSQGTISELEFVFDSGTTSKALNVGSEALDDGKWQGSSKSVTVTYGSTTGHVKLTGVKVGVSVNTSADMAAKHSPIDGRRVVYNLRGQPVTNPTHGLYIVDGKKVLFP